MIAVLLGFSVAFGTSICQLQRIKNIIDLTAISAIYKSIETTNQDRICKQATDMLASNNMQLINCEFDGTLKISASAPINVLGINVDFKHTAVAGEL
jgi:hypothetical protein